ncbi:Putative phosphatase YwpJ [Streptococcus constellatus]|uniref:Phosphatase YwpJ n=1 Tax=Streptococcus constellatus TaxID=76860 RepID=A0A564T1P4_STRCV|nr:Cof-type HAD-IIB family hydrolase [Streptococcus constellatus]VUW95749.1 Putative phosphatase YwpJ [Streptococcus gordonii]VUX00561.1 Putative phosphatase YwpJ [Streptococcus constellatus]
MYQLIAFDMDGTLLASQKTIANSSIAAIDRAHASGKQVALSTGRSLSELGLYEKDLQGIRYAILASGALIYDLEAKRTLAKQTLPAIVVDKVRALAEAQDIMVVGMIDGQGYLQRSHFENIANYYMEIYTELYDKTAVLVDNIYDLLAKERDNFGKINMYHLTADARDQSYEVLLPENITMIKAEVSGLELTAQGVEKGQGLAHLAKQLNLSMEEIIAVGDADNDESMIRAAGLGVAMGNANENIKGLADIIVADNDHGGCAQAIDELLLADKI